MGFWYSTSIAGETINNSNDLRTLVTTATGQGSVVALREFSLSGESGSSTVLRMAINRPGTAGITPTTATLNKLSPSAPNAAASAVSSWGTQPVLAATHVMVPAFNTFGGVYTWMAQPGGEVIVGSQGAVANLSFRGVSGTPVVSGHIIFEEL